MLKHYLAVAVRNVWKHKSFALINILGLALAMAACVFIFIYVHYETHYDTFWGQSGQLYRVVQDRYQNGALNLRSAKAYFNIGRTLKERVPEVVGGTEIFRDIVTASTDETRITDVSMFGAEDSFFDVFHFPFVAKKDEHPLAGLHSAILSESAAIKLFGTAQAVGKWFKVNEGWEFEVTGVFKDLPPNTHLSFDLLLSRKTYFYYFSKKGGPRVRADAKDEEKFRASQPVTSWEYGSQGHFAYLLLQPKADYRRVEEKINQLKGEYLKNVMRDGTRIDLFLQPVRDIHLRSHRTSEDGANGDYRSVMATAILGVVILVIAWINFVNLTLARSLERAKEMAVRKVSGASRLDLIAQHAVEYGLVNLLGAGLAAVLVFVLHPAVFRLLERDVALGAVLLDPGFLWAAVAILLLGVVLSGFYPAFVQSSHGTMILFKPKHKASAHRLDPRKLLVVLQFTASIVLIIGVITIYLQIKFMRTQALGVDIERTLVTYSSMSDIGAAKRLTSLQTYKDKVRALPGVEAVATASVVPGKEIIWQRQDIQKAEDLPNTKKNYDYAYVDHDFIPAFKLALRAGRNFSDNTAAESASVILNEAAVKQVGFADARAAVDAFIWIGAKPFKIVGVIGDYHQESLRKDIRPIIYYCGYKWLYDVGYYAIKIRSKDVRATVESIRCIWKEIYPLDNFEYRFLDEAFDQQYKEDRRFGALFALFTLLAVFVACLGLQGLATYAIQKRTKEIGIRKVNGATVSQIVVMLIRDFAAWVVIAFVIASPIAYTVMNTWLQNYAYRIDLSWPIFAAAGLLAMGIAIGTTFLQAYRAATRNPVEALRYE